MKIEFKEMSSESPWQWVGSKAAEGSELNVFVFGSTYIFNQIGNGRKQIQTTNLPAHEHLAWIIWLAHSKRYNWYEESPKNAVDAHGIC